MNLIVALGLAQITHVVGIDMTDDRTTCISIAVLLHLFYTATFTWMLCEGIQLYFKIIAVFDSESKAKRYIYFVIGWGEFAKIDFVSYLLKLIFKYECYYFYLENHLSQFRWSLVVFNG